MGRNADNTIRVTDETWARLNARKQPGDTFDDVIARLLDEQAESESGEDPEGNLNPPMIANRSLRHGVVPSWPN